MISIFDSGVGGLTVLKEINKKMPEYDLVYFGDSARAPYGGKSEDEIKKYALEDIEFLQEKGAKLIVIACNTVSTIAFDFLKEEVKLPLFGMVNSVVTSAVTTTKNNHIGVLGTQATINSGVYEKRIKVYAHNRNMKVDIFSQSAPTLVPLIESGKLSDNKTKKIVEDYLKIFKDNKIDTLVLACTHYHLLKNIIKNYLGDEVRIIDPGTAIAEEINTFLKNQTVIENSLIKNSKVNIYFSKNSDAITNLTKDILGDSA